MNANIIKTQICHEICMLWYVINSSYVKRFVIKIRMGQLLADKT